MEKLAAYVVREGALTSRDAVGWILRLTTTLAPIHGLGVAHGRVSAKAIQIAEPTCEAMGYLLDASDLTDDPAYQSPERLRDRRPSPADDCWAIGVTLYSVLSGQLPFAGTTATDVLARIERAPPSPLAVFDLGDDDLQLVLDRLLVRDPEQRMRTLDELRAALAAWDRSLAKLPSLRFGKPNANDDDDFDEDEAVMTAVYHLGGNSPAGSTKPRPMAGVATKSTAAAIPHDDKGVARPIAEAPATEDAEDEGGTAVLAPDAPEPADPPPARAGGADGSGPGPILDHPSSSSPVVSSSSWPPKRDVVLAEAHADTARRRQRMVLIGALLIGGVGGAVYMMVIRDGANEAPPRPAATSSAKPAPIGSATAAPTTEPASGGGDGASTDEAPDGVASAGAVAEVPAPPETTATAIASAEAPAADPSEMSACAVSLFPEDTFIDADPDFAFACTEPNPVSGASQLRQLVVASRGDRGVTHGMREWAMMGWYGMAAFTVLRARCCESPTALATPTSHKQCLLDERLGALGEAVVERRELDAQQALNDYGKSIYCLVNSGASHFFDQSHAPRGGELTTFGKTLARAMKP
ncbi:MAG: hypothetical protein RIF41_17830 [Polyangiaceae bacterium]